MMKRLKSQIEEAKLPDQSLEELDKSLDIAINCNVDQITLYPLFTFPYSSIGQFKKLNKVILPNSIQRKRFYYYICKKLKDNGYQQISVWGFLKNGKTFAILAKGASKTKKYIQKAFLNNTEIDAPFITHAQIMAGGELRLELSELPNKEWGKNAKIPN